MPAVAPSPPPGYFSSLLGAWRSGSSSPAQKNARPRNVRSRPLSPFELRQSRAEDEGREAPPNVRTPREKYVDSLFAEVPRAASPTRSRRRSPPKDDAREHVGEGLVHAWDGIGSFLAYQQRGSPVALSNTQVAQKLFAKFAARHLKSFGRGRALGLAQRAAKAGASLGADALLGAALGCADPYGVRKVLVFLATAHAGFLAGAAWETLPGYPGAKAALNATSRAVGSAGVAAVRELLWPVLDRVLRLADACSRIEALSRVFTYFVQVFMRDRFGIEVELGAVAKVLAAHREVVSGFLLGEDVDMRPLLRDVPKFLKHDDLDAIARLAVWRHGWAANLSDVVRSGRRGGREAAR